MSFKSLFSNPLSRVARAFALATALAGCGGEEVTCQVACKEAPNEYKTKALGVACELDWSQSQGDHIAVGQHRVRRIL